MPFGGRGLMLLGMGPLLLAVAFHQIVEQGRDTVRIKNLTSVVLHIGLMPFAAGLMVNCFMSTEKLAGSSMAWICGVVVGIIALGSWYGIGYMNREKSQMETTREKDLRGDQQGTLTD